MFSGLSPTAGGYRLCWWPQDPTGEPPATAQYLALPKKQAGGWQAVGSTEAMGLLGDWAGQKDHNFFLFLAFVSLPRGAACLPRAGGGGITIAPFGNMWHRLSGW